MPAIYRIRRLRKQANLNECPFAPIPRKQPRFKRWHRLVARLTLEECALARHLRRMNDDLVSRIPVS
jgi:hypothetical protein